MRTRLTLGSFGVVLGLFGTYELLSLGLDNLRATVVWLVGGVILHDGVLAFTTLAVVGTGAVLLPPRLRAPLAAAFLVLGTVTVTAIPVLGRFGARADNPTLLDRNYVVGWVLLAAVVGVATASVILWTAPARHAQVRGGGRSPAGTPSPSPRRRGTGHRAQSGRRRALRPSRRRRR